MTGARMEFTLMDEALIRDLHDRVRKIEDTDPFLKSIGEEMLGRIGKRFKHERGPEDIGWAPLSPRTIEARLRKDSADPLTKLRRRGHLAGSINYQVGSDMLKVGTGTEVSDYAAIQQFGGQAGRDRSVTIPARPFLGFDDDDMQMIAEEAADYFFGP